MFGSIWVRGVISSAKHYYGDFKEYNCQICTYKCLKSSLSNKNNIKTIRKLKTVYTYTAMNIHAYELIR